MEAIHTQEAHPAFRGVFSAGSSEDLAQIYDLWAVTYDNTVAHDLAGGGENHPTTGLAATVASALSRADRDGVRTILDCGAGTGAAGPLLRQHFSRAESIVAFDLSKGMLERAAARGVYSDRIVGRCPDMGPALAACPDGYDFIFCAGTFTPNHAPASTLESLANILRPGGHVAFNIRSYYFQAESSGFRREQARLCAEGRWELVADEERPYLPKEGVMARCFVFRAVR